MLDIRLLLFAINYWTLIVIFVFRPVFLVVTGKKLTGIGTQTLGKEKSLGLERTRGQPTALGKNIDFFICCNILWKKCWRNGGGGPRHLLDGERKCVCIQPGDGELNLNVLAYKWGFRCVTIRANNVGSHVETTIGLFSLSFSSFNPFSAESEEEA